MEKMIWEKPQMNEVAFAVNEYVAACGDQNRMYKFKCNAGEPPKETILGPITQHGYVWIENNNQAGLQTGIYEDSWDYGFTSGTEYTPTDADGMDDYLTATYHPCGKEHEAPTTDKFYNGYYLHTDKWDKDTGTFSLSDLINVIIWRGENDDNVHCTANLDMDSWETAKS